MLAPSKTAHPGPDPTAKAPSTAPSLARNFEAVLPASSVTQILAPSKATPPGPPPAANVPSTAPSFARILVIVLPELELSIPVFVTQMLAPSKATSDGPTPTANVVVRLAGYHCRSATWSGLRVNTPETTLSGELCWAAPLPLNNIVKVAAITTKVASNPKPLSNRLIIEFSSLIRIC